MTRRGLVVLTGVIVVAGVAFIGWRAAARPLLPTGIGAAAPASETAPGGGGSGSLPSTSLSPTRPLATTPAPGALEPAPTAVATDAPRPATGRDVAVTVTYSGWDDRAADVEVDGFVTGVVEQGGTCTLTLTSGSSTVTEQHPAHADASTTQCGTVTVPGSRLAPGSWRAVLGYSSATSNGTSAPVPVTVPGR